MLSGAGRGMWTRGEYHLLQKEAEGQVVVEIGFLPTRTTERVASRGEEGSASTVNSGPRWKDIKGPGGVQYIQLNVFI